MAVEIIDLLQLVYEQKRRKVVFNTPRLHAWVHYYPNPGERDDMHCHNPDQTFTSSTVNARCISLTAVRPS